MMKIIVRFDVEEFGVFIPDGYIHSTEELRDSFLQWSRNRSETIISVKGKVAAFSISKEKFIQYLNEVILRDSTERAYYIHISNVRGKRVKAIHF